MLAGSNMSCVDVMYQPYATYFPYQRPSAASPVDPFKKYSSMKTDPLDTSGSLYTAASTIPSMAAALSSSQHASHSSSSAGHSNLHHAPSSSPVATAPSSVVTKLEDPTSPLPHQQHQQQDARHRHPGGSSSSTTTSAAGGGSGSGEKSGGGVEGPSGPTNAQYLSTNCVLFTYYAGDVAANVDEHFTRALSQGSSASGSPPYHDGSSPTHDGKTSAWKATSPMAQRNFPASFWNSAYQPSSSSLGHDPLGSLHTTPGDAYMTSQLHSMSSLGSDPWRYSLSSQSHSVPYSHSHHNVHDMAYAATMAGTSRFQPHYSSLLGPAGRLSSVSGQCDLGKHAVDGWSSRYHPETLSSSLPSHHDTTHHLHSAITAGGIEPAVQEPSKDLYWF